MKEAFASSKSGPTLERLCLAAFLVSGAIACAGPRMVPPADVAQKSEVIEATDRSAMSGALADESFKLGRYEVAEVDRDWNSTSGMSVGGYKKSDSTTAYAYQFKDGKEALKAECSSLTKSQGFSLGGGSSVSFSNVTLNCSCGTGDAAGTLKLEGKGQELSGEVTLRGTSYSVKSVHETDANSKQSDPAGFRVDAGDGPVGAVEVMRPGRIWLGKTLEDTERRELGCLFAGAMLYQPPSK